MKMSLKRGLMILIIISILMGKIKTTRGKIHEGKHKSHRELNKLNYHSLQTRHFNHYFHKKHHKCNLDRAYLRPAHGKRTSRYPTLDKIVHRLDNRIDRAKKFKTNTGNPFDEWNVTTPVPTTFPDKSIVYTYYTVGLRNGTAVQSADKPSMKDRMDIKLGGEGGEDDDDYSSDNRERKIVTDDVNNNNNINYVDGNNIFSKGFMQDYTTSSPWENEQHDISSRAGGILKDSNEDLSTLSTPSARSSSTREPAKDSSFGKLPSWSFSRLGPRVTGGEERKKQTTPMPYVAAHEHYEQVLRRGDCHIPKEKVIRVHEVHPDPSKSYSPSCTILHQCGDDTGCCRDLKQVCKPKNTTKVELYFFTTTLGKPQTVEKLHFVNHTECECQRRSEELMPRDSEFRRSHRPKKVFSTKVGDEKRKRKMCTCPSRYSARFLRNDSCICDCFDKQDDCLALKKGKAHFSYHDKLCIQQGICHLPSCEFGSYIRQFGRCPNGSEKYHYRWSSPLLQGFDHVIRTARPSPFPTFSLNS